ncbi:MAG: hypothetical protein ACI4JF_09910 [Oscillospiraceae bacterium]
MRQYMLFPMPLWMHIIYAVFSIIMMTASFCHKKQVYKLVLAADIAGTLLVYACSNRTELMILGAVEILLYIAYRVIKYYETKEPDYVPQHYKEMPKRSIWDIFGK